jgi:hypothetical protein
MVKLENKMTKKGLSSIGRDFLKDIDCFLLKNNQSLKAKDIANIYFDFLEDLKEVKGDAYGFTGLSEYIVLRFLYHLLAKSFILKSNETLQIGKKACRPDVVVYKHNTLKATIQVKIYLTKGRKEILKEMETFKAIRSEYNTEMKALLVIFNNKSLPKKGRVFTELEKQKVDNDWFEFVILRENDESFRSVLLKSLEVVRQDQNNASSSLQHNQYL